MPAKSAEDGERFEAGIGQRIRPCVELRPPGFHVVHGHDAVLAVEVGQQSQDAGPGADDVIHGVGDRNVPTGRIRDAAAHGRAGAPPGHGDDDRDENIGDEAMCFLHAFGLLSIKKATKHNTFRGVVGLRGLSGNVDKR